MSSMRPNKQLKQSQKKKIRTSTFGHSLSTSEDEFVDSDETPPKPRYRGVAHPDNWKINKKRKNISPAKGSPTAPTHKRGGNLQPKSDNSSESSGADSTVFPVQVSGRDESFPIIDSYENFKRFNGMLHPPADSFDTVPSNFKVRGITSQQCPTVVPKEFTYVKKYPRAREVREFNQFCFLKEEYQKEFVGEVNSLLCSVPASFRNSQTERVRQWKDLSQREKDWLVGFETDFQCFCTRYGHQVPVRLAVIRAFLYRLGNFKMTRRCTKYTNKIHSFVNWDKIFESTFPRRVPEY